MSFSKDIDKFAYEAISKIEDALENQQEKIKQFLVDFLGDDISKIEHIEFDNDEEKFFNLKAPEDIIEKFKAKGYLK
ncbi:MAG: hypothetical protein PHR16_10555 [Methylovulum sp.]|nr:hypothetical protein [Methylovulum sp.]